MKTAKRRKPIKASTLTRHEFVRRGWRVAFVERFIKAPIPKRFDAFGVFDHIAFKVGYRGVLGLQSCACDRFADHLATILASPLAREWVEAGNRIGLMGWERAKVRGGRNRSRFRWIRLSDFDAARPEQSGAGGGTSSAGASPPPAGPLS